jgi:hypothetical protein
MADGGRVDLLNTDTYDITHIDDIEMRLHRVKESIFNQSKWFVFAD